MKRIIGLWFLETVAVVSLSLCALPVKLLHLLPSWWRQDTSSPSPSQGRKHLTFSKYRQKQKITYFPTTQAISISIDCKNLQSMRSELNYGKMFRSSFRWGGPRWDRTHNLRPSGNCDCRATVPEPETRCCRSWRPTDRATSRSPAPSVMSSRRAHSLDAFQEAHLNACPSWTRSAGERRKEEQVVRPSVRPVDRDWAPGPRRSSYDWGL